MDRRLIPKIIKLTLVELRWRQKKLIEESGINQSRLSKIMNGHALATDSEIRKLFAAGVFGDLLQKQIPRTESSLEENTLPHEGASHFIRTAKISSSRLTCCAWSSGDNSAIVGGFDGCLYLIDAEGQIKSAIQVSDNIIRSLCFIHDSEYVVAGDDVGHIFLVSFGQSPSFRQIGQASSSVYACSSIRNGARLLTADRSGDVIEWSLQWVKNTSGSSVHQLTKIRIIHKHNGAAFDAVHLNHDDSFLSVGADGKLRRTSKTLTESNIIDVASVTLFGIDTAMQGGIVACSSASGDVHLSQAEEDRILSGHTDTIRSIQLSSGGKWLLSGGKDRSARLWNLESHNASILLVAKDYVYSVRFSRNGDRILVTDGTGSVHLIRLPACIDNIEPEALEAILCREGPPSW